MYLVDNQIKELIETKGLIENSSGNNISNICYDLRIENIIMPNNSNDNYRDNTIYQLNPGEVVFISTIENINMPNNLCGIVVEKNSLIRLGLNISSPVYQPGHHTKIFIRVQNISDSIITLEKSMPVCSIMFYELSKTPDTPYNGDFSDEFRFTGVSNYSKELPKTKELDKKVENIKNIEKSIYGNVMLLVTIFIGMFSLINLNINFISSKQNDILLLICYNLISIGSIGALVSFISLLLPSKKASKIILFSISLILLVSAIFLYFFAI